MKLGRSKQAAKRRRGALNGLSPIAAAGISVGCLEHSKHDGLAIPGQVVLAHESAFPIGPLRVDPATRQLSNGEHGETVEPRVMQVLVVLGRAQGMIVTRDQLIDRCWDGRIVGDDSVNRVIYRIRQLAASMADGRVRLETLTKVGYRLTADGSADQRPPALESIPPAAVSRRSAMAAGIAAAAVATVGAGWFLRRPAQHLPTARAQALFAKGIEARGIGTGDTAFQSEAYFRQAVEADPNYADAWGALALQMQFRLAGDEGQVDIAERATSAARRALELQPGQADAAAALALIPSSFRRWGEAEQALIAVTKRAPRFWLVLGQLGHLYANTGRWADCITTFRQVTAGAPFHPVPAALLITALWGAGRLVEAEVASLSALNRWPHHPAVWLTHMMLLSYSGRPSSAIAFAEDVASRPTNIPDQLFDAVMLIGRAMDSGSPATVHAASSAIDLLSAQFPSLAADAALLAAATGDVDRAFVRLDDFLFRRPRSGANFPPLTRWTRLDTFSIFLPPMLPTWQDSRFEQRMHAIGMARYWRSVGFDAPFGPAARATA